MLKKNFFSNRHHRKIVISYAKKSISGEAEILYVQKVLYDSQGMKCENIS